MPERPLSKRILYWFVKRTLQLLWVLIYGIRFSGTHNIPSEGGVLMVSNHQSHLDPPLVGCCCSRSLNPMAKKDLFDFAPFAWYIASLGAFPVDLEGSPLGGIREAMRRLKNGKVVLMFPEGSRCFDGKIGEFMNGFTMIAVRTKAAILPVAIEGAFDAWPRTQKFPCIGPRLHVMFGEPILPEDLPKYSADELAKEVERRMRECHCRLLDHPDYIARGRELH
ncbi:MAG: lysophospholipid acyltransferase family protein [Planctomycetota bacterium]|nr:lysophospholipid acyltransferase family protein [Planctomycetota bacterium]